MSKNNLNYEIAFDILHYILILVFTFNLIQVLSNWNGEIDMEAIWGLVGSVVSLIGVFGVQLFKTFKDGKNIEIIGKKADAIEPIEKKSEEIYKHTNNMNPKIDALHNKIDSINHIQYEIKNLAEVNTNVKNIVTYIEYEKMLRQNTSFTQADQIQAAISAVFEKNAALEVKLNEVLEKNKNLEIKISQLITENTLYAEEVAELKNEIKSLTHNSLHMEKQKKRDIKRDITL